MTQYAFYFDGSRCTGCKTCQLACKDYNDLSNDVSYRKVYEYGGGTWSQDAQGAWSTDCFTYFVSIACNHCDKPACVEACPTTAMHKDPDTGLVSVDASKCIGCGYCAMACPYNAPKVDREVGHSVKCDGCASRVAQGLDPICVGACPLRALEFGPIDEMHAHEGTLRGVAPLPIPSITSPNLYIKPNIASKMPGDTSGCVLNPREVE